MKVRILASLEKEKVKADKIYSVVVKRLLGFKSRLHHLTAG